MKKSSIKLAVSSMILASLFSGCVETTNENYIKNQMMSRSHFIDVTKEDYKQNSIQDGIYSLSGLLSIPKLGFIYFHTDIRKPLYMVGYSKNESFYITQTIENNDKNIPSKLEKIRNDMISLRATALDIIKKKIKSYTIKDGKLVVSDTDNNIASLEDTFSTKYQNLAKEIKKEGIFILSWDENTKDKYDSTFSFSALSGKDYNDNNFQDSGFMILNGLKISTLYAGADLVKYKSAINPNIVKDTSTYPRVVTSTIQSKDIYYVSQINYSQEIINMINIHFSEIDIDNEHEDLKKILFKNISLLESRYFNKIKSINSIGITSKMQKKVYPMFYKTSNDGNETIKNIQKFIDGSNPWQDDNSSNWQTIYSVDTDIFKLSKWFKSQSK